MRGPFVLAALLLAVGVAHSILMDKVLLTEYVADGAMCLDGSPPAYYIHYSPSGSKGWIVFLEGQAQPCLLLVLFLMLMCFDYRWRLVLLPGRLRGSGGH
jgi:hypothetical protein